jgi:NADPH:quinone reductase-like Zn-dependent oxidoreductase
MRAAIATGTEDIDEHIHVKDDWPQPTLATAKDGKTGKPVSELADQGHMIVKVLSCALAPGDCRLFKGRTDLMQLPKWGRPYVIGSDICGIVTEVSTKEAYFKVGDRIIARFDEPQPNGMCAEYACVKTRFSEKCPASIPANEACTLPASAAAARLVAQRFIHKNDRVLVLGASGGVGTFLCQYIKNHHGASFLAATTTQSELAKSLGVDRVIDYRTENWWELEPEFKEHPFDVVVDLVNGENWQKGACSGTKVLKRKAFYVQLLSGVETEIDMRKGIIGMLPFISQLIGRSLYARLHPFCPRYETPQGLDLKPGDLKHILEDVAEKRIRVVLVPASPFKFETGPVREAMKLQRSIHAHGKVVIEVAQDKAK